MNGLDRTDLDLRFAAHRARVALVNREGWKAASRPPERHWRAALAGLLLALAEHIAPASAGAEAPTDVAYS
ncbi:MAG TPA: hypothetical protein VFL91_17085 [Thermomicrobiales bacterium]|nr:hypothetical protein [Thermomicrobiales bacterium]